jgi:DNA-damage-inducible protein J
MIPVKVDDNLKKEVEEIFKSLGLSASDAISLFYEQVSQRKGLPFPVDVPNKETEQAIKEAREHKLDHINISDIDAICDA